MLQLNQLDMTSSGFGRPEAKILENIQAPWLKEFRQKLEEKSINIFTKKELMRFLIQAETKTKLWALFNITKENQDKLLEKLSQIDKLPISTFEKTMQSENLLMANFNKQDYIDQLNDIKNIERVVIEEDWDLLSRKNEYSIIVREVNTVWDALARMNENWYNCVFMLWENNKFMWLFTKENLLDKPPFFRLRDVKERAVEVAWNKDISDDDAMKKMKEFWINAIPLLDSSWIFYWVLSLKFKEKTEIWSSAITQITKLNLALIQM